MGFFDDLKNTLSGLGATAQAITQPVIDFGKDTLKNIIFDALGTGSAGEVTDRSSGKPVITQAGHQPDLRDEAISAVNLRLLGKLPEGLVGAETAPTSLGRIFNTAATGAKVGGFQGALNQQTSQNFNPDLGQQFANTLSGGVQGAVGGAVLGAAGGTLFEGVRKTPEFNASLGERGSIGLPGAERPTHQAAIETASNAGDLGKVKQIIEGIPPTDPYRKSMADLFNPRLQEHGIEPVKIEAGLSAAPAKTILDTYKVAEDLKPVQSKVERLLKTRKKWGNALASEVNKLNRKGADISLKNLAKTPETKNLNDQFKLQTTTVSEQIKPNAPQSWDEVKLPTHLTVRETNGLKRDLKKEYGDQGVQGLATDAFNGGYEQLRAISPRLDQKTAKSIVEQVFKDPTIIPEKVTRESIGPTKQHFGDFVSQLVKLPSKDIQKIKAKISTRENKLGPILDQISEMSDQLAGVKGTRQEAIKEGKILRRQGVENEFTPGLTKALKKGPEDVKQAFRDWTNNRSATELEGVKAKTPFKALDSEGIEAFDKVQAGESKGAYGKLNDYFQAKYDQLKKAGITQRYTKNYLPQIWESDPATVEQVLGSHGATASEKTSFTKARVISDYKTGIEKGLVPKYKTISDLVGWYERTANKAIADKQFLDSMKQSGRLLPAAKAPSGWKAVNPDFLPGPVYKAEPAMAKAINNYLGEGSPSLKATSGFVGRIKGIVLGAGIPKTGLNYHGVSIFVRDLLAAKNPLSQGIKTGAWLIHPASAEKFFTDNLDKAVDFRKAGLTVSSEEHSFAREAKQVEGNIVKKIGNKLSEKQQSWFEDPLFGKVLPALKLQYADKLTNDLVKSGKTREQAMRLASKSTNDIFGGINTDELTRSKNFQQLLRTFILAPDWLETQSNIAKGIVKGTVKLTDPQYQAYRRVGRNLLIAYVGANIANKLTSGHWMFQNGPKDQFSVAAGQDSNGKDRYVKIFGGAVDFAKLPYEMIQGIATGDPSAIGSIFRNRLSGPAGVALDVLSNTNPAKGNTPLFGKDQYGNAQSAGTQAGNFASILAGAVLPQQAQAVSQGAQGKAGIEQVLAQTLEAPITYRSKPKVKTTKGRKVATRTRSRKGKSVRVKKSRSTRISTSVKRLKKVKIRRSA